MGCNCGKPKCDGHCGVSPAVLKIEKKECTLFRKVEVPASMGTSVENPPKPGAYRNVLLFYAADGEAYLYSSDGIPTKITGITSNYEILTNKPSVNGVELVGDKSLSQLGITSAIDNAVSSGVAAEKAEREAADANLQNQIDTIIASSDVVDIVGTYAQLQAYDTSKLGNNDIVKVLEDETHGNAISYYRYNKATDSWSYIGSQGPYYTKTETDTLLDSKQNKLTAGSNIVISGNTISATVPTKTSDLTNDGSDGTSTYVEADELADLLPTKTSDLTNDGSDGTSTYVEADELADLLPTDEASGAIASFPDGADNVPVKELIVDIKAAQDLHGQDSPYPAGGGKNIFDKTGTNTSNGYVAGYYLRTTGAQQAPSTSIVWNISEYIEIAPNTTYTISLLPTENSSNPSVCQYDSSKAFITGSGVAYANNATITFTTNANAKYVRISIPQASIDVLQLEAGSSASTYAPYSNVCPISGWTGANVQRTGFNVWDEEWEVGGISATDGSNADHLQDRIRSKNYINVVPNNEYYVGYYGSVSSPAIYIAKYDINKTFIERVQIAPGTKFTPDSSCHYIRFFIHKTNDPITTYDHDVSINHPSTVTDYHAYAGTTYPISWQSQAGTVYGGTLNVLTGELVVDKAMVIYDGSNDEAWAISPSYEKPNTAVFYAATLSDAYFPDWSQYKDYTTNLFQSMTRDELYNNDVVGVGFTGGINTSPRPTIRIRKTIVSDLTAFKAFLANTPMQFVYRLKTSTTYQLTPTEVRTLLGQNNIWADTGDSDVVYKANIQMYIDKYFEPWTFTLTDNSTITKYVAVK